MFLFWDRLIISKIHRKSCRNYHPKNMLQNMQKFLGISFIHGKGPRTLSITITSCCAGTFCQHPRRYNSRGPQSCPWCPKSPAAYSLQTRKASNWLCCWMPKKTPALVSHFNFWRVPALCCCKSKNFWSKVHRTIWRGEHEASVSSFVLKLRGLALLHQERLIVPLWRQARNKHISYVMEDLFCNTGMCRMTVYDLL